MSGESEAAVVPSGTPGGADAAPGPGLRNRVLGVRDSLVANPKFRRWVSLFPMSRGVARRQARSLFDIVAGFVSSQVLLACVRLRIFDLLHAGPLPFDKIAARLGLPPTEARRLVSSAAALGLLEHRGSDRYGLGQHGAALVGNPGLVAMIEHNATFYADLQDPVALLKRRGNGGDGAAQANSMGTNLAKFWSYARADKPSELSADQVAEYSSLMATSQEMVADEVLDAYPRLVRHRCLLDIGGGDGAFLIAASSAAPGLRMLLFDLPAVAARAQERLDRAGLHDRAKAVGGDFRTDKLPRGADVATLVRVVHDHDDEDALVLLRAARDALPPGGTLLLAEPMAGTRGAGPVEAYFAFYLLAMGSGRPRTADELFGLLHRAGFRRMRLLPTRTPMLARVIAAQTPGG